MSTYKSAIVWAVVLLLVAAGVRLELLGRDLGMLLLIVLPVVAILSGSARVRSACRQRKSAQ